MEHETSHHGHVPEDPGALSRDELIAHAQAFAGEIVRWKVWYVKGYEPGPIQASLSEAEAIQALSQVLAVLLADGMMARTLVKTELAKVASLLGYSLQDMTLSSHGDQPRPRTNHKVEGGQDDATFLQENGLRFPDEENQDDL